MKNNPFDSLTLRLNGKWFSKDEILHPQFEQYGYRKNQIQALAFVAELLGSRNEITVQTSGSTGEPKVMSFSKNAVLTSAQATNGFFKLDKNSVALLALPIQYIAGKMMVARCMAGGYNLIVREPTSNPDLSEITADFMPVTPFQMHHIIDNQPQFLKNISTFLIGGGEPDKTLIEKIKKHKVQAFASFGMTETLSHFALAKLGEDAHQPEYVPLPGVEIKVSKEENLLVNWPGITSGMLDTNDVVEKTKNGFIWMGRADNVINSGGIKIIPERVENILKQYIHTPFFIGSYPHPTLGQELVLFSETELNIDLDRVPWDFKHQQPRKIRVISPFLRTTSGKIQRQATINYFEGK